MIFFLNIKLSIQLLGLDVERKDGQIQLKLTVRQSDKYLRLLVVVVGAAALPVVSDLAPVIIFCPLRERLFGQVANGDDVTGMSEQRIKPGSGFYQAHQLEMNVDRADAASMTVRMATDITGVRGLFVKKTCLTIFSGSYTICMD